ncbi:MAG: hypothetical protein ACFB12_27045 [Leptolyngbyaceae cyanobacterium]
MAGRSDPPRTVSLSIDPDHPELLSGLELWLQLGLITHDQVKRLCFESLTCAVPVRSPVVQPQQEWLAVSPGDRAATGKPSTRSGLSTLMAEFSIAWLLLLGVFLVVVSSMVLAATQWQSVSNVGQYLILLGYTLAFWQAGHWTARQSNLQTTSRMLQVATLLIIPINFWMMAGFQLGQTPVGFGVALAAGLTLSGVMAQLLREHPRGVLFNGWGLSWLHWLWAVPGGVGLALYGGILGTALTWHWGIRRGKPGLQRRRSQIVPLTALFLIGRAALEGAVPLAQLGLPLGAIGAVWVEIERSRQGSKGSPDARLSGLGWLLLGLGWLMAALTEPLQAIALSGLAIGLLADPLQRQWRRRDLGLMLMISLQSYLQLRQLPSSGLRTAVIQHIGTWLGEPLNGWQLTGLGLFPYFLGLVALALWLRSRQKPALVRLTTAWVLSLGVIAGLPGLESPAVRSLYLLAWSLTLMVLWWRRWVNAPWLAYLTHGLGVLTLITLFNWAYPTASSTVWTGVLLGGAITEGALVLKRGHRIWQQCSEVGGLVLAISSYGTGLATVAFNPTVLGGYGGLVWLAVPALLMGLSQYHPRPERRRPAAWIGFIACILAPLLPPTMSWAMVLGFALAAVITVGLNRALANRWGASVTVALSLMGAIAALDWYGPEDPGGIFSGLALLLWGLWGVRFALRNQRSPFASSYRWALNSGGIALAGLILLRGTAGIAALTAEGTAVGQSFLLAMGLTASAIAFRLWQAPTNLGYLGLAWGLELLLLGGFSAQGWASEALAVCHGGLGLATQLAGDWGIRHYQNKSPSPVRKVSWALIPLGFVAIAWLQGHLDFTATTGLYSLAAAGVAIGVGRRYRRLAVLRYGGIFALTWGAYELWVYQLMQGEGDSWGMGLTLLALLATAIAWLYGITTRWLQIWWRCPKGVVRWTAHLHWGLSCLCLLPALLDGRNPPWLPLWLGVAISLITYGLWRGRRTGAWVDAATALFILTLFYGLEQVVPNLDLGAWAATISALVAAILYWLPWHRWGWPRRAWRRSTLVLPIVMVGLTTRAINIPSLFLVAGFYGWVASQTRRVHLSYVSVVLANGAIWDWLHEINQFEPLWGMTLISGSILYFVQMEPALQSRDRRQQRHWLRCLAVALFCLTAFYQAGAALGPGLAVAVLGLVLVGLGLLLRVRAYLYSGTVTFGLAVLNLLWRFISAEAVLLWALGIAVGLALIWLAATFEARRSQATDFVNHWLATLAEWE